VCVIIIGLIVIASLSVDIYSVSKQNSASQGGGGNIKEYENLYALPTKFSVPYSVPRMLQLDRGTCWAFGTIGFFFFF
jgi:hypothetical protein